MEKSEHWTLTTKLVTHLEQRCDWLNAEAYPAVQSIDPRMWAWEFLRRNAGYQASCFGKDDHHDLDEDEKAFAWGVSRLANPFFTLDQIDRDEDNWDMADKDAPAFDFIESHASIESPIFSEREVIGLINGPVFSGLRAVTKHTMLLRANQVAMRLSLDLPIEAQIAEIRKQVNVLTESTPRAAPSELSFLLEEEEVTWISVITDESSPDGPDPYELDVKVPVKSVYRYEHKKSAVKLESLWLALRCVDAFASIGLSVSRDVFSATVLAQLSLESQRRCPQIELLRQARTHNWRADEVHNWLRVGLMYVLNGRYAAIAFADLEGQLKEFRRKSEK